MQKFIKYQPPRVVVVGGGKRKEGGVKKKKVYGRVYRPHAERDKVEEEGEAEEVKERVGEVVKEEALESEEVVTLQSLSAELTESVTQTTLTTSPTSGSTPMELTHIETQTTIITPPLTPSSKRKIGDGDMMMEDDVTGPARSRQCVDSGAD